MREATKLEIIGHICLRRAHGHATRVLYCEGAIGIIRDDGHAEAPREWQADITAALGA